MAADVLLDGLTGSYAGLVEFVINYRKDRAENAFAIICCLN